MRILAISIGLMGLLLSADTGRTSTPEVVYLVSAGEAMLPPAPVHKGPPEPGSPGPVIVIRSPLDGREYEGPFEVDVLFQPRVAAVDPGSLRVAYLAMWEIDITERFAQHLREGRLYIKQARVPRGSHRFKLSIGDVAGNVSSAVVRIVTR